MASEVNRQLVDELKGIWDKGVKDGKQSEFVNIATLDPKTADKILVEAASLIPAQTVEYIKSVFGPGVLMVRRDMLLDTFGARQASVGDLFSGNTRWNPKVAREFEKAITGMFGIWGKNAFTTLVGSEQNIQDVVAGVKQTIVVKSVIVPVANMVSNMVQLMNRGVPLRAIIHGVGAKTAEINSYVKRRQREIDLEADLRAAEGKNDTGAALKIGNQIQSIRDSYRRMSIWPLIEAGEFSAISSGQVTAEDLALSDGRWSNFLEKKINSLDGPLREIARYGLVTRDTALFQGLAPTPGLPRRSPRWPTQPFRSRSIVVNTGFGSLRASLAEALDRVVLIESPRLRMPDGTRNLGLAEARGPIVTFLARPRTQGGYLGGWKSPSPNIHH